MRIGKFFGIKVYLHYTWFLVLGLISYFLATGFFPDMFPDNTQLTYWVWGIISSLLLFFSVFLHELSHSLVAKKMDMKVASITLFFFGGVASISEDNITPKREFYMAIAGPILSFVLAGIFFLINKATIDGFVHAITSYLYRINLIIAIFNLVPGFPLDGGRVFRSIIWGATKDFTKATRMASLGGRVFAYILMFVGLANVLAANLAGLWFVVLGGFLLLLTTMSYEQAMIMELLGKKKVRDFLKDEAQTVAPKITAGISAYKALEQMNKSKVTYLNVYKNRTYRDFLGIIRQSDLTDFIRSKKAKDFVRKNHLVEVET